MKGRCRVRSVDELTLSTILIHSQRHRVSSWYTYLDKDPTHPCATSGFVKMCCPNLAVSNKWFFPPPLPEASALPSPPPDLFLFVGRLLALVGALITLRESL